MNEWSYFKRISVLLKLMEQMINESEQQIQPGGIGMQNSMNIQSKACCFHEKERLMDVLFACDYCTESMEERHLCYRKAAKESGRRSRECLILK